MTSDDFPNLITGPAWERQQRWSAYGDLVDPTLTITAGTAVPISFDRVGVAPPGSHQMRDVITEVSQTSTMRPQLEEEGVAVFDHADTAGFVDPHRLQSDNGLRVQADKIILCGGGTNRLLPLPGAELLGSHHDAWSLTSVPESLLVIGAGATGAQVASVFNELGSRVMLFEAGPHILKTEDEDVSRVMSESFRGAGIDVRESFGRVLEFQRTAAGMRMIFARRSRRRDLAGPLLR